MIDVEVLDLLDKQSTNTADPVVAFGDSHAPPHLPGLPVALIPFAISARAYLREAVAQGDELRRTCWQRREPFNFSSHRGREFA